MQVAFLSSSDFCLPVAPNTIEDRIGTGRFWLPVSAAQTLPHAPVALLGDI